MMKKNRVEEDNSCQNLSVCFALEMYVGGGQIAIVLVRETNMKL